jgi:hypothetical protein
VLAVVGHDGPEDANDAHNTTILTADEGRKAILRSCSPLLGANRGIGSWNGVPPLTSVRPLRDY